MKRVQLALAAFLGAALFHLAETNAFAKTPSSETASNSIAYTTKPGDTLFVLWQKYFTRFDAIRTVQRINHIADARRIPSGKILLIPRALLRDVRSSARVESFRGSVLLNDGATPRNVRLGDTLDEGALVTTGSNSFVTLRLQDGSALTVPSQSAVRLTWLRKVTLTGALERRIDLNFGRVRAKVTPMSNPQSNFHVVTPVAVSAVRGTEFRSAFEAGSLFSATQVDVGKVDFGVGGRQNLIPSGFGAALANGSETGLVRLLPAPEIDHPEDVQSDEKLHFSLAPVPGAVGYRLQIARDAGFLETVAETSGDGVQLRLDSLPADDYFVRAYAVDQVGLEGESNVYSFVRRRNSIAGSLEQDASAPRRYRFRWDSVADGSPKYRFQLRRTSPDAQIVVDETDLTGSSLTVSDLAKGTYSWRVGSLMLVNGKVNITWTEPQSFNVAK